jgi:hypothetical protein
MADVVTELEEVLEAERLCLVGGELDGLARLATRKEALLVGLPPGAAAEPGLSRLRGALARNARLLAAAAQGVRDADSRLRELIDGPALETYDDGGNRRTLAGPRPSLSRNA